MRHTNRSCLVMVIVLAASGVQAGCDGKTLDVGTASPTSTADGGSAEASASEPSDNCRDVPLPPTQPGPESLVGTWLLESFDEISSGSSPGQAWHIEVSPERPILAVTFAEDGTWRSASCGGKDKYASCSASCDGPLTCKAGTYTYENGQLESKVANYGTQSVLATSSGLAILGFFATLGYSNLVKIDALPPCQ